MGSSNNEQLHRCTLHSHSHSLWHGASCMKSSFSWSDDMQAIPPLSSLGLAWSGLVKLIGIRLIQVRSGYRAVSGQGRLQYSYYSTAPVYRQYRM